MAHSFDSSPVNPGEQPRPDSQDSEIKPATDHETDEKLIQQARDFFTLAQSAESSIREAALDDQKFRSGDQWPADVLAERAVDKRPCLTINRIPQFLNQVANDQRQNRPALRVHPADGAANKDTAKTIQGLIRHIEYNSNADVAYDTAFDSALTGGFGYIRVLPDFVSHDSFDQEILIKRIRNPFSVYFDPYSQEPDGSDANRAMIVDDLDPDEYRSAYPDSELAGLTGWDAIGSRAPTWITGKSVRVAEYLYRDTTPDTLVLLSNGFSVLKSKIDMSRIPPGPDGQPVQILKQRETQVPVVKWVKLNGLEVLERTVFPCKWIPIIPVYGTELYVDGKRILEGIVRNAKDPQRMLNYWKSAETEAIALAPRAPFIAAEGQIEGYEKDWENANRRNHSVLKYKPTDINGAPVPPPQRNAFEPAVQAITMAAREAADDLKATTGIYDPSLGAGPADTSGIAIQKRNVQAQTSNFHFIDNLTRSLRHVGRIVIDMIPSIYDAARAQRIIGDDGQASIVQLNQQPQPGGEQTKLYDVTVGRYDVTVDVGPSFASKRQEAAASMMDLARSMPQLTQVAGDIIVSNMDWQGAQEISDRLKKTLPPGLADDPAKGGQPQIPPQVQAQLQQQGQMIQTLTEHLKHKTQQVEQKSLELESKERIAFAQIKSQEMIALAQIDAKDGIALLNAEIKGVAHRLDLLNDNQPIEADDDSDEAVGGAPAAQPPSQPPTGGAQSPGQPMEQQP